MAKIVRPQRSSLSIFKRDDDLKFFYEDILLYAESDRTSYGDASILKTAAKAVGNSIPFDFEYENYEKKMQTPVENVFYFSAEVEKSNSNRKNSAVVKKWFKHIRNAFAHNYITIENGLYVLRDYYQENQNSYKQVLFAMLTSLEDFKKLVKEIKRIIN